MQVLGVDLSTNMIQIGKQRAIEFKDDKVLCFQISFEIMNEGLKHNLA